MERQLPGLHALERASTGNRYDEGHNKGTKEVAFFDTLNVRPFTMHAPRAPPIYDSLNHLRRMDSPSRSRDRRNIEHRHQEALRRNPRTFYRRAGPNEEFLETACKSSDMLVWQLSSKRGEATTSLLNTSLSCRPRSEVYDLGESNPTLAMTFRHANSPHLRFRHRSAQARRLRFEVEDHRFGTLQRPRTTATAAMSRNLEQKRRFRDKMHQEATDMNQKLLKFERCNHRKFDTAICSP